MQVSREQLLERFQLLSDEELLTRLAAGTLTRLAVTVATEELQRRGIEVPAHHAAESEEATADSEPIVDAPKDADLVTVARFWDPLQANVLRNCLESQGVFAHVLGEYLAGAHIFLSVASGGTQVKVHLDDVEQAREIIAAFERGDFAIDEEPQAELGEADQQGGEHGQ